MENPAAGHEYRVYQIFTGDVSTDGGILSNIRYCSCFANAGTPATQDDLDKITDTKEFVKELLSDNERKYTTGVFTVSDGRESAVLTQDSPAVELPAGYYLVIDTVVDGSAAGDAVSDFVVEIVGSRTFRPKATSVPKFDKIIDDREPPAIEGIEGGGTYGESEILIIDGEPAAPPEASQLWNDGKEYTLVRKMTSNLHWQYYGQFNHAKLKGNVTTRVRIPARRRIYLYSRNYNGSSPKKTTALVVNGCSGADWKSGSLSFNRDVSAADTVSWIVNPGLYDIRTKKIPVDKYGDCNRSGESYYIAWQEFRVCSCGAVEEPVSDCGSDIGAMAVAATYASPDASSMLSYAFASEEPGEGAPAEAGGNETSAEEAADTDTDTTVNYGVGDSVPFMFSAVMPDSITLYGTYSLVFHDSMTDGLTYDEGSLKVFSGKTEIPAEHYTVSSSDGMKSFTVPINDAKAEPFSAVPGSEISVKYTATLNGNAVFRNMNNAFLEYSNNPNGQGTGTSVPDDVTVFTFQVGIDKEGSPLEGAGFTLYRKAGADDPNAVDGYVKIRDKVSGGTSFSFTGLAAGDYKLVESTTPDGYNTMEDLEFSIAADSAKDSGGNTHVTGLKIMVQGWTVDGLDVRHRFRAALCRDRELQGFRTAFHRRHGNNNVLYGGRMHRRCRMFHTHEKEGMPCGIIRMHGNA